MSKVTKKSPKKVPGGRSKSNGKNTGEFSKNYVYVMVYMEPKQKKLIENAAEHQGVKVSAFVRSSAVQAANKVLE